MMITPSGIAISFAGSGRGDSRPVVARIVGFAQDGNQPTVEEMVVPAGEMAECELPHGLYNVELTLPSGRILQRAVTIDDDSRETFRFFEDFVPGAGFSLQEAAGRSAEEAVADAVSRSPDLPQREARAAGSAAAEVRLLDNPAVSLDAPPARSAGTTIGPDNSQGGASLWTIVNQGEFEAFPHNRKWARVELPDGRVEMASLPLPWFRLSTQDFSAARVLVDPARSEGAATRLAIDDPRLAGLLAYLDRGQAGSAGAMLDQLERDQVITRAIEEKMANPLAACAAAYVGLAVYNPAEREVWDHWLASCMRRFPALPDAAIVHARRIVLRPSPREDNSEAANALLQACEAGIPCFSAGVMLLRDMVTLLAPDHRQLGQYVEWAARLASRTDPGQAFTVLRYAPGQERPG